MERKKGALILDIDGVVLRRFPFQFKAVLWLILNGPRIYLPPREVPTPSYEEYTKRLSIPERIFFLAHLNRTLMPGVLKTIPEAAECWDIYGNTGRPRRREFLDLTKNSLEAGGVLGNFEEIFYKPPGVRTRDSKMSFVGYLSEIYEQIKYLDDNPADALPIARAFPNIDVRLMQDWSTGFLLNGVDRCDFPNVTLESNFRDAVLAIAA